MFHTIELNRKINYIHERALRIVYRDNSSSFIELPKKDNSVFIHYRNIQSLAIELYKVKHTFSNFLILDIIPLRSVDYNLRTQTDFLYKYQLVRSEITNFFLQKCGIWYPTKLKASLLFKLKKKKSESGGLQTVIAIFVELYFENRLRKRNELSSYT